MVDALKGQVANIETVLRSDVAGTPIANSFSTELRVPLGPLRLHTVELILKLVQMRNADLYSFLKDSLVFERIIALVKAFPWNNFLQLKVINLFEEVLNSCQDAAFKAAVLESSGIGKAIVDMADDPAYKTDGGKAIRQGYMAVVIDVANKMVKRTEQPGAASTVDAAQAQEDMTVINYLDTVQEWKAFVEGELSKSNKKNNKTLGGSSRPSDDDNQDDEGEINYDVQMDKIMARFNSFNQII